jgi:hypothetical protein
MGIELILGNGEVVWASAEENRDLFFTAAGSCGSLGVISKCLSTKCVLDTY